MSQFPDDYFIEALAGLARMPPSKARRIMAGHAAYLARRVEVRAQLGEDYGLVLSELAAVAQVMEVYAGVTAAAAPDRVTLAEAAGLGGCAGCGRRAWAAAVGAEQVRLNARDAGGPATLIPGVDYDPIPAADNDCEED